MVRPIFLRTVARAVATVGMVVLAAALTSLARDVAESTLYIYFVGAVACAAWMGGWRVGVLATALSVLVVDHEFIAPAGSFGSLSGSMGIRLLSFVLVAACVIVLIDAAARARRQAERLTQEADVARARAEDANVAKSSFLSMVSHEIRTPINAVLGYADLMHAGVGGAVTPTQRMYLDHLRVAGHHLLDLVNDVLDQAAIDAGMLTVHPRRTAVAPAIETAIALVLPQAQGKGVSVTLETCDAHAVCWADPDRVRQIVVNLLANAVKFTPAGGSVRVMCDEPGPDTRAHAGMARQRSLRLRVVDSGVGIAPADQARIFEAFEQVTTSRARTDSGIGLGLAISKRLALLMDGQLTVESEPGRGATFTLMIPAAPHASAPPAPVTAPATRQSRRQPEPVRAAEGAR